MENNKLFEKLLDERHTVILEKFDDIISQLKTMNGKVADHEKRLSNAEGFWNGVNKILVVTLTVAAIVIGAMATMLWH